MDYQASTQYQTCQSLFDRIYPNFRDAGQIYQDILARLVTSRARLLEIGCGRNSLASREISRARSRIGIDLNIDDLAQNPLFSHVVATRGESLPFFDTSFDLITSQWVMEHLAEPELAFGEMARVLRPGGHLIIFTTNSRNYIPRLSYLLPHTVQKYLTTRLLKRPERETYPVHYRANTRRQIAQLASLHGLEMRQSYYVGNPFYLAFSPTLFRLALCFERVTDWPRWQRYKLYLLVVLQKRH